MIVTGVLWTGNSDPVPGAQEAVRFLQSQVCVLRKCALSEYEFPFPSSRTDTDLCLSTLVLFKNGYMYN